MAKIRVGSKTIEVNTHPNAPYVINYYDLTPGGKRRYNHDPRKMKYWSMIDPEFLVDYMNDHYGNFGKRVYYKAN